MARKKLFFSVLLFLFAACARSQDCGSKVTIDHSTKQKEATLVFDTKSSQKISITIKTIGDKLDCFLLSCYSYTTQWKPGFEEKEKVKQNVFGNSGIFYLLFDNKDSIKLEIAAYLDVSNQTSFCKSGYLKLITDLGTRKLIGLRLKTSRNSATLTDWRIPADKQNYFIEAFKCFADYK
ncbi:MAG: hypothetical protein ABJA78_06815 [Ferruginibacter sp.]